jgi:phosphonate transport system ATP-binding protein
MDVLTNVMVGRIAHTGFLRSMTRSFTDEDRARAIEALERLDLVPQALQRAGTLSGGQQQRVAIAKALCRTRASCWPTNRLLHSIRPTPAV